MHRSREKGCKRGASQGGRVVGHDGSLGQKRAGRFTRLRQRARDAGRDLVKSAAYVLQPALFTPPGANMASSQQHNSHTQELRSSADGMGPQLEQLERVQERVGVWVSDHPWTMVGAAAGVGVALGAATRMRAMNDLTRM